MVHRQRKAARRYRRSANEEGAPPLFTLMKRMLTALPITVGAGLLLLFVATALLLTAKDPLRYHAPVAMALLYLTAAFGGFLATRLCGRRAPLLCGIFEGLCLLAIVAVIGLCLPDALHRGTGKLAWLTHGALPLCSLLGALLAARKTQKRRRRR